MYPVICAYLKLIFGGGSTVSIVSKPIIKIKRIAAHDRVSSLLLAALSSNQMQTPFPAQIRTICLMLREPAKLSGAAPRRRYEGHMPRRGKVQFIGSRRCCRGPPHSRAPLTGSIGSRGRLRSMRQLSAWRREISSRSSRSKSQRWLC